MSRRQAILLVISALLCISAWPAMSSGTEFKLTRAEYFSPRMLGMGGAFTAVSNDRNLFFTNPAGLAYVPARQFGFELFPISLNSNSIDAITFFTDNRDTFEDLNNLSNEEQAQFYDDLLADIGGKRSEASTHLPVFVLLPAREGSRLPHLGFGFFARAGTEFLSLQGAAGIPIADLDLDLQYTFIASAAYSWDRLLPGQLTAGGSLKFDRRRLSLNRKSLLALSESEKLDFLEGNAVGIDLGAMYDLTPEIRFGASLFDVISSDFTFNGQDRPDPLDILNDDDVGVVDPTLVVGVAFHTSSQYGRLEDLTLTMDIREPFDGDRSFWRGIHIGAESKLGFARIRAGFFEGYPGGGFGLGPLEYAYYSNEAGRFAGARSNYAHTLALGWRFGL